MYTKDEAIETYVMGMDDDELMNMVSYINSCDGSFPDCEWFEMELLDALLESKTPTEILNMSWFGSQEGFNPNRDYFKFDAYGNLVSGYDVDVVSDIKDSMEDIIEHLQNGCCGETDDFILDAIINADDAAMFDENFEEVEEDDEE